MKLLKLTEVARLCGVCRKTVQRWLKAGTIKSVRMTDGGNHLFDEKEVEKAIKRRVGK